MYAEKQTSSHRVWARKRAGKTARHSVGKREINRELVSAFPTASF